MFKPDYIGQTDVPHGTRSYQHGHTDKNSAIFKDSKQKIIRSRQGILEFWRGVIVKYSIETFPRHFMLKKLNRF